MSAILEIDNLNVVRGHKPVLRNLSLRIEAGKTIALLGPNGAGKSSLVLAMAGVLPIASGTIRLDGQNLVNLPPETIRRSGIAAILEGHQVLTDLTVEENLRVAGFYLGQADLVAEMNQAYAIFPELLDLRKRLAGTLSGGQQQMVAVAHALMARPKFILADELSLGLAPLIVKRLMNVLEALANKGCGILLIEQFTHVALRLADYVYVVNRGRVHFQGLPAEVKANPSVLHEAYLAGDFDLAKS
ncbi:MAG: ABC transporter ATP-binding protein [Sulfuritalea sp.]|jgi:branched-chain amino acid transport system ATP-binding protein|nr:ABC transporter ATP-binding protein [Sulfuritalea sp.]